MNRTTTSTPSSAVYPIPVPTPTVKTETTTKKPAAKKSAKKVKVVKLTPAELAMKQIDSFFSTGTYTVFWTLLFIVPYAACFLGLMKTSGFSTAVFAACLFSPIVAFSFFAYLAGIQILLRRKNAELTGYISIFNLWYDAHFNHDEQAIIQQGQKLVHDVAIAQQFVDDKLTPLATQKTSQPFKKNFYPHRD